MSTFKVGDRVIIKPIKGRDWPEHEVSVTIEEVTDTECMVTYINRSHRLPIEHLDRYAVSAKGKFGNHDIEAEVLNPGHWFGKTWLVGHSCGYSIIWFAVEADCVSDALDEFAENDRTRHLVEIDDSSKADYGFEVNPGDIIGGTKIESKGWMDMNGKLYSERPPCASEPSVSGQGIYYDDDHLEIHGREGIQNGRGSPWDCLYFSNELPAKYQAPGIKPTDYADREWENEDERFDTDGSALEYGRCDICGSPCDMNGCVKDVTHQIASKRR